MRRSNSGIACVGSCCANSYRSSIRACTWDWELLDVAIVERFVGDVVLGVHQGISGQRLRHTRCGGRLGRLTPCWAFLGCHGAISLWTHDVSRDMAYFYDTPWRPPCHRAGRGFAFTSCPGVSSRHDDMPMLLLRPCHVILSVSGRAWQRAHQRHRTDAGAFQETCHDEEIQA